MNEDRLFTLTDRYLLGVITMSELQELDALLEDQAVKERMEERIHRQLVSGSFNVEEDLAGLNAAITERIHRLNKPGNTSKWVPSGQRPVKHLPFPRRWWAAASVILLLASGIYWWISEKNGERSARMAAHTADIQPGRAGAILTLADGSSVLLDDIRNGVVALQGGTQAKVVNGALVYEGVGEEAVYNTMSTPKGRQYHVTLPDGSEVWLNSASSIRYPTVFRGNERKVEITGEAYFEVAKNKEMPFRVDVNGRAEVEVLGTHFNINGYEDEPGISTTLLEGLVRVGDNRSGTVVLKPGQQAQVAVAHGEKGIRLVDAADIEKTMAWKNGLFNFEDAGLNEVLRQLERWYDIKVVYEGKVPNIRFGGEMSRNVPLSDILKTLESYGVHYRMEQVKELVILEQAGSQ